MVMMTTLMVLAPQYGDGDGDADSVNGQEMVTR